MFQATLFDYNGVLVDDEHVHLAAFQDVLAPLGFHLTEDLYWAEYLGFDDAGVFRTVLGKLGQNPSEERVRALVEQKKPHYLSRARGQLRGFDGARELLLRRAAVGPVVIVSGALRQEIELGLEVLGVTAAVSRIVAAEDVQQSKPDPEGYDLGVQVLGQLGVTHPRASSVVFEDSIDGIEAALAANLACIAIAHSYPEDRLRRTGAHAVVNKIADIDDALLLQLSEIER